MFQKQLNLILMDLEMPIMDGVTCVKQIREWESKGIIKGHVPVIAVTANARKGESFLTITYIHILLYPLDLRVFMHNHYMDIVEIQRKD